MPGIRQGFFATSSQAKNEEINQNASSSNLTSTSNQHSSQQQQNKQQKMTNTAMASALQEKLRKQVKSALRQEVSEFNPFGHKTQILEKRIKNKCYYCNSERHLYKNCLKFQNFEKQC